MQPVLANWLVLAYLLVSALALAIYTLALAHLAPQNYGEDLLHFILALSTGLFALWLYSRYVRRHSAEIRWRPARAGEALELSLYLILFGLGFTAFVGSWAPPEYLKRLAELVSFNHPLGLLFAVINIALFVPLVEEWIFRGFMLESYRRRKGAVFALYAQALIFGLLHGEVLTDAGAFFIGLILGRYLLSGGSLYAAFVAHAANNLASALGVAFDIPFLRPDTPTTPAVGLLGLLLLAAVVLRTARRYPVRPEPPTEPGPVVSLSLIVALFIGVLLTASSGAELFAGLK